MPFSVTKMYSLLGKVIQIYMGGMNDREMSFTSKTIMFNV